MSGHDFAAGRDDPGYELYVYNPKARSFQLAADIWPGSGDGAPHTLIEHAGDVYGRADIPLTEPYTPDFDGTTLFRFDPDTGRLDLIDDGPGSFFPAVSFADDLYGAGRHLERYDPDEGTFERFAEVADVRNPVVYDGDLYFGAYAEATGRELYRLDGRTGEVLLAADIIAGADGSDPRDFNIAEGVLTFLADDGQGHTGVYAYDASTPEAGAEVVAADIGSAVDLAAIVPPAEEAVIVA